MQQKLGTLRVAYLIEGKKMLNEMINLSPTLTFMRVTCIKDVRCLTLSFVAHSNGDGEYGQTGGLIGLLLTD